MLGSQILEVAVGIVFVYLLVSIMCSAIREGIEAWLKSRAAYLEYGIRELLHDRTGFGLAAALYQHPLVYSLYSGEYTAPKSTGGPGLFASSRDLPSYIPARNFALALMDLAARGPDTAAAGASTAAAPVTSLAAIRANVANLGNPAVQRLLLTVIDAAQGDLNRAQANIEAWYDSAMDRVSGWYKRSTHIIIFGIGLALAVLFNVNTITIADYLYRNDAARAVIVAKAEAAAGDADLQRKSYEDVGKYLDSLDLPIGWTKGWGAPRRGDEPLASGPWNNVVGPLIGWLLTALAATMGAPFWFDLLNKIMVIRSTVKPHEKSGEEGSEDRQPRNDKLLQAIAGLAHTNPTAPSSSSGTRTTGSSGGSAGSGAASPPGAAASSMPAAGTSGVTDARAGDGERAVDSCVVDKTQDPTADEDLPPADGGVVK